MRIGHVRRALKGQLLAAGLALLLSACGGGGAGGEPQAEVRLGSWYLQGWGTTKASDAATLERAASVIALYGLVAVQDVADVSGASITTLLNAVNTRSGAGVYAVAIGDRAGRTTAKTQQVVFYRTALFELVQKLQYPDADATTPDLYERDPLLVSLRHKGSARLLALVSLDLSPTSVAAELDGLITLAAFAAAPAALNTAELLVVGSFKADCAYLSDSQYGALLTVAGPSAAEWTWQTSRTLDSTAAAGSCAYDHLLTHGSWSGRVVAGSVQVLDLALQLGIDATAAAALSSQMPVEMRVRF